MKKIIVLCVWLCVALPAAAAEITVSAAASLRDAFAEMAADYQTLYPDAKVKLNTGASGTLLRQLLHGAPVDVLATADEATMRRAVAAGAVRADSRVVFAGNALVLVLPKSSPHKGFAPADLRQAGVRRIAVGQPDSVPAGAYAKAFLLKQGLWADVQAKLVYAQNVRQALAYVARGEADAGLVYRTDALSARGKVRVAAVLAGEPVRYPAAVSSRSRQPAEARRFVAYLQSARAQGILQKYGFSKP